MWYTLFVFSAIILLILLVMQIYYTHPNRDRRRRVFLYVFGTLMIIMWTVMGVHSCVSQ